MVRTNILHLHIIIAILIFNLSVNAQSGPRIVEFNSNKKYSKALDLQKSSFDSLVAWQEQIVLQTDKSLLAPKDYLFFKAYILTGPNQIRVSASDVLRVELLDEKGTLIKSQNHKIEKGTCQGSIEIPKKTIGGNYYLRAYTRWMLNYGPDQFATKKIKISGNNDISESKLKPIEILTVFPEGGQLVAGLTHNVVVSIKHNNLEKLAVINSKGEEVALVKKYGMGLGTFLFKPANGERYSIKLNENRNIPLPDVQGIGYSMQASNLSKENLSIRIEASPELRHEKLYIKGKGKGVLIFKNAVDFGRKDFVVINIPKTDLPKGLLNLSLEDEFDQVWADRPIYIDQEELQIRVEQQTESSGIEIMSVRVTDQKGMPIQTELSVSLVGQNFAANNFKFGSQRINLKETHRKQRFLNDMLALTRQLPEDFQGGSLNEVPDEIRYAFQDGLEFYGQAYDLNNTLLANTKIQILISANDEVIARETQTNADGLFNLSGLQVTGETDMVLRTKGGDSKSKLVKVIPYEYEIPPLKKDDIKETVLNSSEALPRIAANNFLNNSEKDRLIALDEITLAATKPFRKTSPSIYNIEPTRVIYQDVKRPRTLPELFLGIPGLQVVGLGSLKPSLVLRNRSAGWGPIVWVIDGFPMMPSTSLVDIINLLSYVDIERIELLIGGEASMYGSRSAGGVIQVYTRTGSESEHIERKAAQMTYQGFHESISFENYRDTVLNKGKSNSEMPTTLYWNPYLVTDENGEATIMLSFPADYEQIKVEAYSITENGARGSLKTAF